MSKPRTGSVRYVPPRAGERWGHYEARVTVGRGKNAKRPWFDFPPSPRSAEREKRVRERVASWGEHAPRVELAPAASGEADETWSKWIDTWLAERKRRGIVRDVSSDVRTYITPATGEKHIRDWTASDLRALCRALDENVQAGKMAWKTAVNIWGTATRMCRDACQSKIEALRVREDNPATGVAGPDRGVRKGKQFLYPSEFLAFVQCERVPLAWRRAVTVAVYLFPRASELRGLSLVDDVDLEHGSVHIHQSLDGAGNAKPTKSKTPRRFTIEPNLMPLLRAMVDGGAACVEMPAQQQNLSAILRKMLKRAGVDRAELHTTTATRKAMTWHDLRSTGLTWLAVAGVDALKIQQRAGHTNFQTTQLYIRLAEAIGASFGEPFPALPTALLNPSEKIGAVRRIVPRIVPRLPNYLKSLCEGEDLNLHEIALTRT